MQASRHMTLLEPCFVLGEQCPGAGSLQGSFLQTRTASERGVLCRYLGVRELSWQQYLLDHLFPRYAVRGPLETSWSLADLLVF